MPGVVYCVFDKHVQADLRRQVVLKGHDDVVGEAAPINRVGCFVKSRIRYSRHHGYGTFAICADYAYAGIRKQIEERRVFRAALAAPQPVRNLRPL